MSLIHISKLPFILILLIFVSPVKANEAIEKQVKLENITINYRFFDIASEQKEPEMSKVVDQAFGAFSKLFGGLPRDLAGTKYSEFTIELKHSKRMGGDADPRVVMLEWSDGKEFGYADWRTALIHEVFHLWSAESIRYKDGREQWFNEGVSEYYAFKIATQLGLITAEEALTIAAYPIGYYSASKGLGNISMRDAGRNDKTKFENFSLIYHGGWVVAMVLDQEIRSKTKGVHSMDDLMAWMYMNYPRHEKLYDLNDILLGLKKTTNLNFSEFLSEYVAGVGTVPIGNYLNLSNAYRGYISSKHDNSEYRYFYQTLGINSIEQ